MKRCRNISSRLACLPILVLLITHSLYPHQENESQAVKSSINPHFKYIYTNNRSSAITVLKIAVRGGKRVDSTGGLAYITTRISLQPADYTTYRKIVDMGSDYYFNVRDDHIEIMVKSLTRNLDATLKFVAKSLKNPIFSATRINSSKRTMDSMQKNEMDLPLARFIQSQLGALSPGSGYGLSSYGTQAGLKTIKRKAIQNFYTNYFNLSNMLFVISTDADEAFAREMLEKHFSSYPTSSSVALPSHDFLLPEDRTISIQLEKEKILVGLGLLMPGFSPQQHLINDIIHAHLNQGIGSKLWNLRLVGGLAYNFGAVLKEFSGASWLAIYVITKKVNRDSALQRLQKIIADLGSKGISESEVKAARAQALNRFHLSGENKLIRSQYIADLEIMGLGIDYQNNYADHLDAVTTVHINSKLREYFHPDKTLLVEVGPGNNK